MRVISKSKIKGSKKSSLFSAVASVLEPLEKRQMMTATVITAWNFDNTSMFSGETITSPATSTGTGTASSVGMTTPGLYTINLQNQSSGTFTLTVNDSTGTHTTAPIAYNATIGTIQADLQALPAAGGSNASFGVYGTATNKLNNSTGAITIASDATGTLTGTGSNLTSNLSSPSLFFVAAPYPTTGVSTNNATPIAGDSSNLVSNLPGSTDTATTNNLAWKIVGNNGWNSSTGIGNQGAQFLTSTVGDTNLAVQFDINITKQGESKFQVEYTTDGSTWNNISAANLSVGSNAGIAVVSNSTVGNTVVGGYFQASGTLPSSGWFNALQAVLPAGAANQANFGFRIVSATTGAADTNAGGTALNNTSGNWSFDDVQLLSVPPTPVTVVSNPVNVTTAVGIAANLTASATGFPTPVVQWYNASNNSVVSGATSSTYPFTPTAISQSGISFFASFGNTVSGTSYVANTSSASVTVLSGLITTQPISQSVNAGGSLVFSSVEQDHASTAATVQWQLSNGSSVTTLSAQGTTSVHNTTTGINTVTSNFTITPTAAQSGDTLQAVFTDQYGNVYSYPVSITVVGEPITAWQFTQGEGSLPAASEPSPANTPTPTLAGNSADNASILGLENDFSTPLGDNAIESYPEADILPETSTLNTSFTEYVWRVRGGQGLTGTGAPGFYDAPGWSQFAPEYANGINTSQVQGVQFDVNTVGYTNVTFHYDWNQGGISAMQPQYYQASSGTWINVGGLIQTTGSDYYGYTTAPYAAQPSGVLINLQNIPDANNNPNFEIRLVTAYDPGLPLVTDGNSLDPTVHGQYPSGGGSASAVQQLVLGTSTSYNISFGGMTTGLITNYGSGDPTDNITAITNALVALSNVGSTTLGTITTNNITVTQADITGDRYLITFGNALKNTYEPTMVAANASTGTAPAIVTTVDGGASSVSTVTIDSSDNFVVGTPLNITVASATGLNVGDTVVIAGNNVLINSITGTTLNVTPQVVTQSVIPYGTSVVFEADNAYTNSQGGSWALGNISVNGFVMTGAPTIVSDPQSLEVPGSPATSTVSFTAIDYSDASPISNNSVEWQVSTNGGGVWNNVSSGTVNNTSYNPTTTLTDLSDTITGGTAKVIGVASTNGFAPGETITINGNSVTINAIVSPASTTTSDTSDTLTAGTPTVIGVASTTGFAVGETITVGGNPVTINAIASGTSMNVSSASTVTIAKGAVVALGPAMNVSSASTVTVSSGNLVTLGTSGSSSEVMSTYSFTGVLASGQSTPTGFADDGYEYRAVFTNGTGSTASLPATLTVVAPITPAPLTLQNVSVQVGNAAVFSSSSVGLPTPTVQWQTSTGSTWTNVYPNSNASAGQVISVVTTGFTSSATSVFTIYGTLQSENGTLYRAVYFNAASPAALAGIPTNGAVLTVLSNETVITDWNFNTTYPTVNSSKSTADPYINNPAPATGVMNSSGGLYGTASIVGMNEMYNASDPATGTDGYGDVPAGDIVNSPSVAYVPGGTAYNENTWRVRGADANPSTIVSATAGTPNNGWSNLALQATQGAQWMVPTTGYAHIYVTIDLYTTTSGILDGRQQYTTDGGATWINLDDGQVACTVNLSTGAETGNLDPNDPYPTISTNSNDFYGATSGGIIPLVYDLTNIPGANNNAGFGIRFTSAYNQTLVDASDGLHDEYANAALVGNPPGPQEYNGSKGNWRFDNIIFHGDPSWLDPASVATWDEYTQTLTVTGTATIIGDPAASGDSPNITVDGAAGLLDISPAAGRNVSIGGIALTNGSSAVMTSPTTSDILIVGQGGAFSIDSTSKFNLGKNFLDLQAANASQGAATLSNVAGLIQTGFNGGAWNGNGLYSTTAQSNPLGAIGYISNNGLYNSGNTFDFATPGANDVLVRYTYYGDANLDGKVDGSDYSDIDAAYLAHSAATWLNGNFNYDSSLDGSDYTLIDNAFNSQGAILSAEIASQSGKNVAGTQYAVPTSELATVTDPSDLLKKKAASWASTLIDSLVTT